MNRAISQYKSVNVESSLDAASPYQITKMLYSGCLNFLKQAEMAIDNKDFVRKAHNIAKAEAIIATLAGSLKSEENPEVSENLARLYEFCLNELIDASLEMDSGKVGSVRQIITELKSAWESIPMEAIKEAEYMRQTRGDNQG